MSLSPIALEALRAAQAAFTKPDADIFEDALARGLEAVDREGRLVGAFAASELARLESLVNAQPATLSEAQVEALAAAGNRAVNDATHDDLCACDAWPEKCLSSGGFFQGYWDMGGLETAIPAVIGLWESMRADTAADELGRLRARVAELEAERHSTNEAPSEAAETLREQQGRIAELEAARETVWRASHDAIVMGLYTTPEAAQAHCEAKVQQEEPAGSIRHMSWVADDIGDDAEYELHITPAETGGLIRGTGYLVTPLEVASAYDEEADE